MIKFVINFEKEKCVFKNENSFESWIEIKYVIVKFLYICLKRMQILKKKKPFG